MNKVSAEARLTASAQISWRDYFEMCKPKVVALMLVTAIVGMLLASPGVPPLATMVFATIGIGLAAGSAAVINHLLDRRIDAIMARTKRRPMPTGKVAPLQAILFAVVLAAIAMFILFTFVNSLTAILSLCTLFAYAIIYTVYLKRATPQNIVIGGAAGAAPPILGWAAMTGHIAPESLLLFLIIFTWTPPHFWALAIYRHEDYAKAEIPMLPVTHGIQFTKRSIFLYTILLLIVSVMPFAVGMSGWLYLAAALILGARFFYWATLLLYSKKDIVAMKLFRHSINYLFLLFIFLLLDHYLIHSLY